MGSGSSRASGGAVASNTRTVSPKAATAVGGDGDSASSGAGHGDDRAAGVIESAARDITATHYNQYELVYPRPIGKGATSLVYHVKDPATGVHYALKSVNKAAVT